MAEKTNIPYDTISRMSVSTQSIFNKCCCFIPLRTGCFILGYLNLVLNCFQTLALLGVTFLIGSVTHGFDHFDNPRGKYLTTGSYPTSTEAFNEEADHSLLFQLGFILVVLLIVNLSWIIINIACLVGLHKRNPGPIRVYVGFAIARLMLGLSGFIYLVMSSRAGTTKTIVTHCIDLGLTAYFIMVYYIYANRLEKEREASIAQAQTQTAPVNNAFIYPTKLDKSHLVA